jgi:predicted amidohydrolase
MTTVRIALVADAARRARTTVILGTEPSLHEKAMLCRASENTGYFASVNAASNGSGTTSAVFRPDGTLQAYQPYGQEGLLIADLDLGTATGQLASRCRVWEAAQENE